MALPQFKYCLLCEDLRQESGGLASLLGFYGPAPDVEILLKEIDKPLRQLTFVVIGSPGEIRGKISLHILDESNRVVVDSPSVDIDMTSPQGKTISLVMGIGNLKFPRPGRYKFLMKLDGHVIYENTFGVGIGKPEDFLR